MERIGGEQQAMTRIGGEEPAGDQPSWAGRECECPEFCRIDHDND